MNIDVYNIKIAYYFNKRNYYMNVVIKPTMSLQELAYFIISEFNLFADHLFSFIQDTPYGRERYDCGTHGEMTEILKETFICELLRSPKSKCLFYYDYFHDFIFEITLVSIRELDEKAMSKIRHLPHIKKSVGIDNFYPYGKYYDLDVTINEMTISYAGSKSYLKLRISSNTLLEDFGDIIAENFNLEKDDKFYIFKRVIEDDLLGDAVSLYDTIYELVSYPEDKCVFLYKNKKKYRFDIIIDELEEYEEGNQEHMAIDSKYEVIESANLENFKLD